jgi:hypothetical protein
MFFGTAIPGGYVVQPGTCAGMGGDCLLGGVGTARLWGSLASEQYPVQGTAQVSGPMHSRYDGNPRLWSKPKSRTPATGDGNPEPDPPPQRLSAREERAALWAALDLPPHERR